MKKVAASARRQSRQPTRITSPPTAAGPAPVAAVPIDQRFPIVGIGASAGGLEALEQFFPKVPPICTLAFVVVQHQNPNDPGVLAQLLQRSSVLPVVEISDHLQVQPGHVYVIPPNRDLTIRDGVLHLREPVAPPELRLPIDCFFHSLADDQQAHSIGVILSGTGFDGTLGLRAIKEQAGAVFVQTPTSAKFDGMPNSAIAAGLADVIAPAAELPERIFTYLQHLPRLVVQSDLNLADTDQSALETILTLLRTRTGHDLSCYKKSAIYAHVVQRMGLNQLDRIADYVHYLQESPQESDLIFKQVLIGMTCFFRDPEVWEQLKTVVIPALLAEHPDGGVLRCWSAGCANGEEAFSLAIVLREALEQALPPVHFRLQIFATDLYQDAIDQGRSGRYPDKICAAVSEQRLQRFFVPDDGGCRVNQDLRDLVVFATQNLIVDPPLTKLDLLVCRNLLIYLEEDLQKKIVSFFHDSLNPGGILVLGTSETADHYSDLFAPLPAMTGIYRRIEGLRANAAQRPGTASGSFSGGARPVT